MISDPIIKMVVGIQPLEPLEFTDCLLDSPEFRENLQRHEKELDKTSHQIKRIIKEVKDLLSAAQSNNNFHCSSRSPKIMLLMESLRAAVFSFDYLLLEFYSERCGMLSTHSHLRAVLVWVGEYLSHLSNFQQPKQRQQRRCCEENFLFAALFVNEQ